MCEEVHLWALMLTKGGSGLLVYANSARKLDVKVWIKVVLIIPNCTEQGSVPPDMQEKKSISCSNLSPSYAKTWTCKIMPWTSFSFYNLTNVVSIYMLSTSKRARKFAIFSMHAHAPQKSHKKLYFSLSLFWGNCLTITIINYFFGLCLFSFFLFVWSNF